MAGIDEWRFVDCGCVGDFMGGIGTLAKPRANAGWLDAGGCRVGLVGEPVGGVANAQKRSGKSQYPCGVFTRFSGFIWLGGGDCCRLECVAMELAMGGFSRQRHIKHTDFA